MNHCLQSRETAAAASIKLHKVRLHLLSCALWGDLKGEVFFFFSLDVLTPPPLPGEKPQSLINPRPCVLCIWMCQWHGNVVTVIVFDVRVKFILLSQELKSRLIEFLSNYFRFISHIRLRKGLADNLMKMCFPQMNVLSYSEPISNYFSPIRVQSFLSVKGLTLDTCHFLLASSGASV